MTTAITIRFSIHITPPHTNPDRAARARAEGERRRARERAKRATQQQEKRDE
jgi:hypothetical protein